MSFLIALSRYLGIKRDLGAPNLDPSEAESECIVYVNSNPLSWRLPDSRPLVVYTFALA